MSTSKRVQSVDRVAEMVQKNDIVICLWSSGSGIRNQLFNLLTGSKRDVYSDIFEFYPQRIMHPTSRAQILFISMPNPWHEYVSEIKLGLQRLLTKMDQVHIKFSAHIWVDRIYSTELLSYENQDGWYSLKKIFGGNPKVEMDSVTLLLSDWEMIGLEKGLIFDMEIQEALEEDVKKGLTFSRLSQFDCVEAWWVMDGLIELRENELVTGRDLMKRAEWEKERRYEFKDRLKHAEERQKQEEERQKQEKERQKKKYEEDRRVDSLQREIGDLYAELDKTEYGREIRAKIKKVFDDQTKMMQQLLTQLNYSGLKPEEKQQLEKVIDDEYILFLREFRGYFAEVRAMRIEIGPNLREFYGLLEPKKKKKKRLGLF